MVASDLWEGAKGYKIGERTYATNEDREVAAAKMR